MVSAERDAVDLQPVAADRQLGQFELALEDLAPVAAAERAAPSPSGRLAFDDRAVFERERKIERSRRCADAIERSGTIARRVERKRQRRRESSRARLRR